MVQKWNAFIKLRNSTHRRKVLSAILERVATPRDLEKQLDMKISNVSRALIQLVDIGLAKCLTPELGRDRLYIATKKGKNILAEVMKELKK